VRSKECGVRSKNRSLHLGIDDSPILTPYFFAFPLTPDPHASRLTLHPSRLTSSEDGCPIQDVGHDRFFGSSLPEVKGDSFETKPRWIFQHLRNTESFRRDLRKSRRSRCIHYGSSFHNEKQSNRGLQTFPKSTMYPGGFFIISIFWSIAPQHSLHRRPRFPH
jgi:hypothetical protein